MYLFTITFTHAGRNYKAIAEKSNYQPVQFIVHHFCPLISSLPERLVFLSHPSTDQLICQSFETKQREIINAVGEAIFISCSLKKIPVHH